MFKRHLDMSWVIGSVWPCLSRELGPIISKVPFQSQLHVVPTRAELCGAKLPTAPQLWHRSPQNHTTFGIPALLQGVWASRVLLALVLYPFLVQHWQVLLSHTSAGAWPCCSDVFLIAQLLLIFFGTLNTGFAQLLRLHTSPTASELFIVLQLLRPACSKTLKAPAAIVLTSHFNNKRHLAPQASSHTRHSRGAGNVCNRPQQDLSMLSIHCLSLKAGTVTSSSNVLPCGAPGDGTRWQKSKPEISEQKLILQHDKACCGTLWEQEVLLLKLSQSLLNARTFKLRASE